MADHIPEQSCCDDLTQKQYLGLFEAQRDGRTENFFRALFRNQQFLTTTVIYDVIKSRFPNFHPQVMCDPCATPELVDTSDMFERLTASGVTLKSMIAIDCGEIERETGRVQPGVQCNEITSPLTALQRVLARKSLPQASGFDDIEECLAMEMVVTECIDLPKSQYMPNGGNLSFKRDEELNCKTSELFGCEQKGTMKILRRFFEKLECFEGGNQVTDVLMHCDTAEDMLLGKDMQDCLKSYRPELFLGQELISAMTDRALIRPRGVNLFYTSPDGIRFWKVNMQKKFFTHEGEIRKYDVFPKNKLIALDLSGGPASYRPIMGYTPITDLQHIIGQGTTTQTVYAPRFVKSTVTFEPAGWKQVMQSNILPLLPYCNGSACLDMGVEEGNEVFEAPVERATRAAKKPAESKKQEGEKADG